MRRRKRKTFLEEGRWTFFSKVPFKNKDIGLDDLEFSGLLCLEMLKKYKE